MPDIVDQPPPVATSHRPAWELVIEYAEQRAQHHPADEYQRIHALVIADMRDRDRLGRERYGTPLQPFNGRNNLVDAYQELQDYVVYLRNELSERGVSDNEDFSMSGTATKHADRWIVMMFCDGVRRLYKLRELIEQKS